MTALNLPLFQRQVPLVEDDNTPTVNFHRWWQDIVNKLKGAINSLSDAIAGVEAAQTAAAAAQATANTAQTTAVAAQATADSKQDGSPVLDQVSDISTDGIVARNPDGTFDTVDTGTGSPTSIITRADGDTRYALAASAGVSSFNTRVGDIVLTSLDVTNALTYVPTSVTGLTGTQTTAAFKTGLSLVKADVGLGSVDNTADSSKNVLTATKLVTARTVAMSGDVVWSVSFDGSGNVTAAGTIQAKAVTLAKMDDVITSSVFYRKTAGAGAPEIQTLATLKTDLGLTGTNTGDQTITLTGDATGSGTGSFAVTVVKINGVSLSGLATGILKNTTTTGVPSIAIAADFPTLNQNTTGSSATLTTPRNIDGQAFDGSAAITVIAPGTHAATSKTTPVDADELSLVDSAASNVLKKLTWANLKATTKAYFDTLYQGLQANLTAIAGLTTAADKMLYWTGSGTAALLSVSSTNRSGLSNLSGTNTGDQTITLTGDATGSGTGSFAVVVGKVNGVSLAGLATGILKNTTTTGAPSIAVAGDFPTLNQSTTGSAATLTTARAIYGNNFDGSAALGQIIASTYGGTGNGFSKLSGPASSEKTFTLPNASDTIVCYGTAGTFTTAQTFINSSGIKIQDTDASNTLGIIGGSNLTSNRTLTLTTGDASRVLTMTGDASIAGTNTGDQTTVSGNAGSATVLQTSRNFSITGGGITAASVGFDGSAAVALSASVDAGHITLARMANLAANSIIGNNTGSAATPLALTVAQTKTLLAIANTDVSGLGTASTKDTGTSGTKVPLLDGVNTWSGAQTITAAVTLGADLASKGQARFTGWRGSPTSDSDGPGIELGYTGGTAYCFGYNRTAGAYVPALLFGSTAGMGVNGGQTLTLESHFGNFANDATAATGGVPVGGLYRNGSILMVRVT